MGKKFNRYGAGFDSRRPRAGRSEPLGPVLLACEKCEHRLAKEGRFRQIAQMQQAFDSVVADAEMTGSGLRVLPVSCLDVCPSGAIAVTIGAQRGRGPADTVVVRTPQELRDLCAGMITTSSDVTLAAEAREGADEGASSSDTR